MSFLSIFIVACTLMCIGMSLIFMDRIREAILYYCTEKYWHRAQTLYGIVTEVHKLSRTVTEVRISQFVTTKRPIAPLYRREHEVAEVVHFFIRAMGIPEQGMLVSVTVFNTTSGIFNRRRMNYVTNWSEVDSIPANSKIMVING